MDERIKDSDEYRRIMKSLGPPPLSEVQKIEERWPFTFPLDHLKGEVVDAVVRANRDIFYLLNRIRELEELTAGMGSDKALSEVLYEYHERADKAEARVRELEEGLSLLFMIWDLLDKIRKEG